MLRSENLAEVALLLRSRGVDRVLAAGWNDDYRTPLLATVRNNHIAAITPVDTEFSYPVLCYGAPLEI